MSTFKVLPHKGRAGGNPPQHKFLREAEALLFSKYDTWRLMFEHSSVALAILIFALQLWEPVQEY